MSVLHIDFLIEQRTINTEYYLIQRELLYETSGNMSDFFFLEHNVCLHIIALMVTTIFRGYKRVVGAIREWLHEQPPNFVSSGILKLHSNFIFPFFMAFGWRYTNFNYSANDSSDICCGYRG